MEKPISKRQLGILLALAGTAGIVLPFLVDLLGAGQFQGVGPAQRLVLLGAVLVLLPGLSLLPLGDRPA